MDLMNDDIFDCKMKRRYKYISKNLERKFSVLGVSFCGMLSLNELTQKKELDYFC